MLVYELIPVVFKLVFEFECLYFSKLAKTIVKVLFRCLFQTINKT